MSNEKEIRDLFGKHSVDLAREDVWTVQSSHVVKHKALERLAAALKIKFAAPQILRAERDEAVILATGSLGDMTEWSIGEALVNANYRVTGKMAPYVYAMAEKRAKDRVIIKLAGLHGVYSEDEADDFKEDHRAPTRADDPAIAYVSKAKSDIQCYATPGELKAWWEAEVKERERNGVVKGTKAYDAIWDLFCSTGKKLASRKEAA